MTFRHPLLATISLLFFLSGTFADDAPHWPQFRGPGARGIASGKGLPDRWTADQNVAWKSAIPGRGWSSPVVWGERVFLTTVVNTGTSEAPKKGLYFGGNRPTPPASVHQWKVLCLDLVTGAVVWERQVHEGLPESAIHLKNSYASETPVTDGQRVYCSFGNVGVFCFDLDGVEQWRLRLAAHATRFGWGTAASPALHQGRLYLVNDNDDESHLLALDAATGKEQWRVVRDEKSNWSTPFIWTNSVRTEIVTLGTGAVRSYDLNGQLLWSLKGMSSITTATPYEHAGLLYISSGYVLDALKPLYAIRPGARGDISLPDDQTSNQWIAWCQKKAAPYNPSSLIYNDRLYVLYDRGLLACFNPRDGAEIYTSQRLPDGRAFTASPWAYGDRVFCLNEDGVTFVLKAGSSFELLHTNPLADDDMCMATPAIVGDRLLIRTAARVYCIRTSANASGCDPPASNSAYDPLAVLSDAERPTVDLTLRDSARQRDIPLRLYLPPPHSQAAPVVLFSHGLGGTREGSKFLGRHWSVRGFVAVFLQHPGSDDSVWRDQPLTKRMAAMNQAASAQNLLWRVRDVSVVIDQLEKWNQEDGHTLRNQLDLARLGMSGHSFGAVTTQSVSGQSAALIGQRFTDRRIRAAIAFSPSPARRGDPAGAFGSVKIPWLLMTGTKDTSVIGDADAASRLKVFPGLPSTIDKYELVLDNAEHSAFTDRALPGDQEQRNPNHHRAILALTTAFWDAYLRQDAAARAWLQGPDVRRVLEAQDRWQFHAGERDAN